MRENWTKSHDLTENINAKVKSLRNDISEEISTERNRINEILINIQSLQTRMNEVEQGMHTRGSGDNGENTGHNNGAAPGDNPRVWQRNVDDLDRSIIIKGLPYEENENVQEKITEVLSALGEAVTSNITVLNVHRFHSRFEERPEIVKVSFSKSEEKHLY